MSRWKKDSNTLFGLKQRSEELCLASAGTRTAYNSSHRTQIDKNAGLKKILSYKLIHIFGKYLMKCINIGLRFSSDLSTPSNNTHWFLGLRTFVIFLEFN